MIGKVRRNRCSCAVFLRAAIRFGCRLPRLTEMRHVSFFDFTLPSCAPFLVCGNTERMLCYGPLQAATAYRWLQKK